MFVSLLILSLFPLCVSAICYPNIPDLQLQPVQYNGSWFVIAIKSNTNFLPTDISSSMIQLLLDPDSNFSFTEFHKTNDSCLQMSGVMKKHNNLGYMLYLNHSTSVVYLRAIYHGYSGEQNEEMNMVLYGCVDGNDDGGCLAGDELVMIMSNSRHPQTLQLYKSAQVIEDDACIDILHFKALDTYTECGDEATDEDQKLRHAKIDEDNEFVDVECRVENIRPPPNNITQFFKEPRVLTVVAYIDSKLSGEQIAHISCRYENETNAVCEWIRQDKCFITNLSQTVSDNQVEIASSMFKVDGSETEVDWSGFILWENGDEYISMHCGVVGDDGACDSVRVYVWSDEDHMDQPTIQEIYRQLQSVCVDPTDLIFLNTFHECSNTNLTPITPSMLDGVWYVAADLNADPKLFLQSAVVDFEPIGDQSFNLTYYAQIESDGHCVGGSGHARVHDRLLSVRVDYKYSFVADKLRSIHFDYELLYLDNQRAVLYWCFKRNGSLCTQHDVTFMIRSRHFSHNDLSMIEPYLDRVRIEKDDLRWFDLHSQCGSEISSSTILRRDLVTLSHYHVLDILTNVQEPKCVYNEVRGVKADLSSLERAGTWFLMSRMDEMSMDTYAMVGRVFVVSDDSAVLRLFQSAALPGEGRECFTRVFTIRQKFNDSSNDYWYELHFESTTRNSTLMVFRFLFYNRNVGVLYSCLRNAQDGKCDEKAIYVISRHETIDHSELTVLEKVAKSVCVEPTLLYHVTAHDECVIEPTRLKPPACSSIELTKSDAEWQQLDLKTVEASYGRLVYQVVGSTSSLPFAITFDGKVFQKITEQPGGCLSTPIDSLLISSRNRFLIHLPSEKLTALIHPFGHRSELLLREAQLAGSIPCLESISASSRNCTQLSAIECETPSSVANVDTIKGEWMLHSSDPMYVLNMRCTFDDSLRFECFTESWDGECERATTGTIDIKQNRFEIKVDGNSIRTPDFELFSSGFIEMSNEFLLMFSDDHLVGRRYTLMVRNEVQDVRDQVKKFCVWPNEAQIRQTAMLC